MKAFFAAALAANSLATPVPSTPEATEDELVGGWLYSYEYSLGLKKMPNNLKTMLEVPGEKDGFGFKNDKNSRWITLTSKKW